MSEKENQKETIAEITRSYEQKIVELEKQHQEEIEKVKEEKDKEKELALKEQQDKHNKELSDYILGRKEIKELENDDIVEEKSFFDKGVESTKKLLGID